MLATPLAFLGQVRLARQWGLLRPGVSPFAAKSTLLIALGVGMGVLSALAGMISTYLLLARVDLRVSEIDLTRYFLAVLLGATLGVTSRDVDRLLDKAFVLGPVAATVLTPRQALAGMAYLPMALRVGSAALFFLGSAAAQLMVGGSGAAVMAFAAPVVLCGVVLCTTGTATWWAGRRQRREYDATQGWTAALLTGVAIGAASGPVVAGLRGSRVILGAWTWPVSLGSAILGVIVMVVSWRSWRTVAWSWPTTAPVAAAKSRRAATSLARVEINHILHLLRGRTSSMRFVSVIIVLLFTAALSLSLSGELIRFPDPAAAGMVIAFIVYIVWVAFSDALEPTANPLSLVLLRQIPRGLRTLCRVRLMLAALLCALAALFALGITGLALTGGFQVVPALGAILTVWQLGLLVVLGFTFRAAVKSPTARRNENYNLYGLLALPSLAAAFGVYALALHLWWGHYVVIGLACLSAVTTVLFPRIVLYRLASSK